MSNPKSRRKSRATVRDDAEITVFPDTLPALILRDLVVFPLAVLPIRVAARKEVKLVNQVVMRDKLLAVFTARTQDKEDLALAEAYDVGCIARILQLQHLPDGSLNIVLQALRRCRIEEQVASTPYPVARITVIDDPSFDARRLAPLAAAVRAQMVRIIHLSPNIPDEMAGALDSIEDPGILADVVATNLSVPLEEKQALLSTVDRKARLEQIARLLAKEVELLELSAKIQSEVKGSIEKGQREFYLRQQMKAIRDELGENDRHSGEIDVYREKIDALSLPKDVDKEIRRELDRLEQISESSAEYPIIVSYLDWIVELPWTKTTPDRIDIGRAEEVLDADHYGLDKVKRRILEFLAVRKLKPDAQGPILCFAGPPGVGKTSLGRSIASALGREFVRMSLGGMRDEAEIRGHRRTYVGAMPGRIIQSLRKAGTRNPVFMLDEIDKLGQDFRGDPASALLEVLDPAQNDTFTDLYLNVPFDLSKVMFVATANVLDTIPWALRDRMEIIELPGYTLEEKLEIARRYLVPRQLDAHGLTKSQLKLPVPTLRAIIANYTREAGVRNLDREIGHICRGVAPLFAGKRKKAVNVGPAELQPYLGRPRVFHDQAERLRIPGVATGLAWTAVGGDILFIEATRMKGKGQLILTGQLGKVMKESAQTVLSWIRANAARLGIEDEVFSEKDIHIHVPAGAVPKDGPSAGVTMLTAVVSLLLGKRVKHGLAMTGEITLRGAVLPVGGIKEKVLAAQRAGIKELILPARCEADVDDVPVSVREKLTFHYVTRMEEVLALAIDVQLDKA